MKFAALVSHLEKFASGTDRSVQWAKDAETLLDDIEEWDELIDELQDALSLYRPGGGPHLIDESEMHAFVGKVLVRLTSARRKCPPNSG